MKITVREPGRTIRIESASSVSVKKTILGRQWLWLPESFLIELFFSLIGQENITEANETKECSSANALSSLPVDWESADLRFLSFFKCCFPLTVAWLSFSDLEASVRHMQAERGPYQQLWHWRFQQSRVGSQPLFSLDWSDEGQSDSALDAPLAHWIWYDKCSRWGQPWVWTSFTTRDWNTSRPHQILEQ